MEIFGNIILVGKIDAPSPPPNSDPKGNSKLEILLVKTFILKEKNYYRKKILVSKKTVYGPLDKELQ